MRSNGTSEIIYRDLLTGGEILGEQDNNTSHGNVPSPSVGAECIDNPIAGLIGVKADEADGAIQPTEMQT